MTLFPVFLPHAVCGFSRRFHFTSFLHKNKGAVAKYSSLSYLFISKRMRLLLLLQRSRLDDEFYFIA